MLQSFAFTLTLFNPAIQKFDQEDSDIRSKQAV
jgi:hypothetical protein